MNLNLYPKQMLALVTPANEILYGGAAGGGKSMLVRAAAIFFATEVPGLQVYIFRRTFKELMSNHVYTPGGFNEMLKDLLDTGFVRFNKSEYAYEFGNGSRITLAHCQYESDVETYQGAQIGLLIIDEATHFTAEMVSFLRGRVRLGSLDVPEKYKGILPRIIYASNPGGIGHNYFKSNFVNFGTKIHTAPDDEGGMIRQFIPAKLRDNIVLMKNDPNYAKRLMGLSNKALVKAMLDGDWDIMAGGMFDDVWRPDIHIMDPFKIPKNWRIDRAFDWGSSKPAACVWFAESNGEEFEDSHNRRMMVPKGSLFAITEKYFADDKFNGLMLPASTMAYQIKSHENILYPGRVQPGPADNTIFDPQPGHPSIATQMLTENIRWVRSNKAPGSRVRRWSLMRERFEAASHGNVEKPGLWIFDNCHHSIRTIPVLPRDDKDKDDVNTDAEDHLADVFGYRVLHSAATPGSLKVIGA